MSGRFRAAALAAAGTAIALTATACGSTPAPGGASNGPAVAGDPTVTLMVGGINKQIYLPYQLAQDLGFYKKYGVNVQLSTEQSGGVGAETAMASGQVDMAGAWYEHTIDFQQKGKSVEDVVQLSGAPGERIMCGNSTKITSPAQWKGKTLGVTDLGSGTDELTQYLAARYHLTTKQYTRVAAGDGNTMIAGLQRGRIACGMTTQPTVAAIEQQKAGYMAFDLATTAGVKQWLGGFVPTAGVLALTSWVNKNKTTVQKVVDALVATMHWINTHSGAQIAAKMPADYVSNSLVSKSEYVSALSQDKTQFLPDGIMPAGGPQVVEAIGKTAGTINGPVNLPVTYTNSFATAANKLEGYSG